VITYLPPLDEGQVATQIQHLLDQGLIPAVEYAHQPGPRDHYWSMWKLPLFGARAAAGVQAEIGACAAAHPDCLIKLIGYDAHRQTRTLSLLVRQPRVTAHG
jgi:ribulose-bisphosphate carboxylase small chain